MTKKHLLAISMVSLFFLLSCQESKEDFNGLWVSESFNEEGSDYFIHFENDTISSEFTQPDSFFIKKKKLYLEGTKLSCPYDFLGQDRLAIELQPSQIVEFERSKFNNILEHRLDNIGIKIDLPFGFSHSGAANNTSERIYIDYKKETDSLMFCLNEKKMSLTQILHVFQHNTFGNTSPFSLMFAVDKNLPWKKFDQTLKSILDAHNFSLVYHCLSETSNYSAQNDWINICFSHSLDIVLYEEYLDRISKDLELIKLKVDENENITITINKEVINDKNLLAKLDSLYSKKSNKIYFELIESETLTYGRYLFLVSLLEYIILENKEKYLKENHNLTLLELKNLAIENRVQYKNELNSKFLRIIIMGNSQVNGF